MLVSSKNMILDAQRGGYAIGSFNTSDLEITKAIIQAAEAEKSPVIIATSEKAIQYGGLEVLAALIREQANLAAVPVALHLDHGKSIYMVQECLATGYTSIMLDGSEYFLEKNIEITAEAAKLSHAKNTPCEGELGHVVKVEEKGGRLVIPSEVQEFVAKTGVDFLAPAIGSSHGAGEDEHLDLELLRKIKAVTEVPLALHGASGVPENEIRQAIQGGIHKINIDTDIRHEFTKDLREILKNHPGETDPRDILGEVIEKIQILVQKKIRLFGSQNKI